MDCCLLFPGLVACTARAEYSRAKIVGLDLSEQPAHSIYPAPQGQLWGPPSCGENRGHRRLPKLGNPPEDFDLRSLPNPRVSAEIVGIAAEVTIIFPFLFLLFFLFFTHFKFTGCPLPRRSLEECLARLGSIRSICSREPRNFECASNSNTISSPNVCV